MTQRDFGEGERINLRGTLTTLTNATFNGHALSTADWFILDQQNATRSFNYLMFPADLIGKVEVQKTAQADVQEGGIGGTVNIQTRKPLDLDPFTAFASLEGAYTETVEEIPIRTARRWPAGTTRTTCSACWWRASTRSATSAATASRSWAMRRFQHRRRQHRSDLVPTLINSALFQQDRIRKGGNFDMQFKPNDQLEFNLNGFLSIFDAENTNQSWLVDPQRAIGNGGTLTNCVSGPRHLCRRHGHLAEQRHFGFRRLLRLVPPHRQDHQPQHRSGHEVHPDRDAGPCIWISATPMRPARPIRSTSPSSAHLPSFSYDFRNGAPQVTMLPNGNGTTVDWTNPNSFVFDFANDDVFLNKDKEAYVYLDAEEKLDLGVLKSVKFGFKAHQPRARRLGRFHDLRRLLPAHQHAAGLGFRRRPGTRRFPAQHRDRRLADPGLDRQSGEGAGRFSASRKRSPAASRIRRAASRHRKRPRAAT